MNALHVLEVFAVAGLPVGFTSGLLLGPLAQRPAGAGGYGSFARRAARLGHVCTVMLPLLAGFYALAWSTWRPGAPAPGLAVGLWVGGGTALAATLFAAALRPAARWLLPLPALAVTAAGVLFAAGLLG